MAEKKKHRIYIGLKLPWLALAVLALFFFLGIFLGQVLIDRVPDATGQELKKYLSDFLRLGYGRESFFRTFLSLLDVYFRYPTVALFLGFTAVGMFALPCITAIHAFFLSFSVSCFTATFGTDGVIIALAVLGLRCFIAIPCYFFLSVYSCGSSVALARLAFGRGHRGMSVQFVPWRCVLVTGVILLTGMCVDAFLSPRFLRLILEHISM